jgi:RNA polymerase subunit RPABC4/transcription elongation factor Spt4
MPSSSDSEPAAPPADECDDCGDDLAAGEWWVFEIYSETRDLLLEQRVLCPTCYDEAFTSYD